MDILNIEQLLNDNNLAITSKRLTLKEIAENNYLYSVPLYQRLYVWKEDQVETLLEDLERASTANEEIFFLGGIMVTKPKVDSSVFDLIDGQQRFTTLWLISQELKNELENFTYSVQEKNKTKRVSFAIRDFANHYFDNPDLYKTYSIEEQEQLENILLARKTIESFFNSNRENEKNVLDRKKIADFIYNKVCMIQTEMPITIDENRLFETLNNRGVQLKHHEILKAKLTKCFNNDGDRLKYSQLWEASSIMDNYVEKNIKEIANLTWKELQFDETKINESEEKEVGLPTNILNNLKSEPFLDAEKEVDKKTLLKDILKEIEFNYKPEGKNIVYDSGVVRSIISFEMLLLHVLRIFIFQKDGKNIDYISEVNDKALLQIFEKVFIPKYNNENEVKEFIMLLWDIRVKFDKYVIKWVEVEKEEHHIIQKLYLNKDSLQRKNNDSIDGFALLQSMLYHSQQIITHYWLTPFLYKMLHCDDYNELYIYLKKLDNAMFCGQKNEDLKERSWNMIDSNFNDFSKSTNLLNEKKGTNFPSYWFYKLEFILWHQRKKEDNWDNYRMTKKNSVEHISPQSFNELETNLLWEKNENLTDEKKEERLDDFGNLVLLSVGMNSEYGKKTFNEKKTQFETKRRLDSLKSDLIFKNNHWNFELCAKHRDEMISKFNIYIDNTMKN